MQSLLDMYSFRSQLLRFYLCQALVDLGNKTGNAKATLLGVYICITCLFFSLFLFIFHAFSEHSEWSHWQAAWQQQVSFTQGTLLCILSSLTLFPLHTTFIYEHTSFHLSPVLNGSARVERWFNLLIGTQTKEIDNRGSNFYLALYWAQVRTPWPLCMPMKSFQFLQPSQSSFSFIVFVTGHGGAGCFFRQTGQELGWLGGQNYPGPIVRPALLSSYMPWTLITTFQLLCLPVSESLNRLGRV